MTFPVWSGINAEAINSTEINGCAPTPTIVFDGFSAAVIPVLMGLHPGLYFEVVHARGEQRAQRVINETRSLSLSSENKDVAPLPENKTLDVDRSRKRYP
jgi:hypothetical protein